jgi:hypothetical protein
MTAEDRPTQTGDVLGTPVYMAPEQAQGRLDAVDRRADIYALGATLYELLTGDPPLLGKTIAEVIDAVIRREPVPPSRRNTEVDRDLETVVLKCLEKEPELRYDSAQDLANDLLAWLEHRPIAARPLTHVERMAKWKRRNKELSDLATLALAAVALLTLVAGTAFIGMVSTERDRALRAERVARQAEATARTAEAAAETAASLAREESRRAEHRAQIAQSALRVLVGEVKGELQNIPGEQARAARQRLLEHALDGLELLATSLGPDRTVADLASAKREISELAYYSGNLPRAEKAGLEAVEQTRRWLAQEPTEEAQDALIRVLYDLGDVYNTMGRYLDAKKVWGECLERIEARRDIEEQEHLRKNRAAILGNLAIIQRIEGHLDEAQRLCEEALSLEAKDNGSAQAATLVRLVEILIEQGDATGAAKRGTEAVAVARKLIADEPNVLNNHRYLPRALNMLSRAQVAEGKRETARGTIDEAIALIRTGLEGTPSDPVSRYDLASSLMERATQALVFRDFHAAERDITEGVAVATALSNADSSNLAARTILVGLRFDLAKLRQYQGNEAEARAIYTGLAAEFRASPREGNEAIAANHLATTLGALASSYARSRDLDPAIALTREAIDVLSPLADADPAGTFATSDLPMASVRLASFQLAAKDPAAAIKTCEELGNRLRAILEGSPKNTSAKQWLGKALGFKAQAEHSLGKIDDEAKTLAECLAIRESFLNAGYDPYRVQRDLLPTYEGLIRVARTRKDTAALIAASEKMLACLRALEALRPGQFASGVADFETYLERLRAPTAGGD